ncbi:MAG: hypothetical protein PUJ12_08790 [Oscillospiraceae bacterium]|nr:hypothetical protein [Oscillospiraceae bacterium]
MDWVRKSILFGIGGGGYVALELLYRGRSHISMFAAGGVCFLLIGQLDRLRLAWPVKMVCGAGIITCVEFLTGLLVNRNYQVWDYRDQPGNLMGQICPRFMLLWIPLSLLAMVLYRWVSKGLDRLAG